MIDALTQLTVAELESVYDSLAMAIDRSGRDKVELFLVKLALMNAEALGDAQRTQQLIATALKDL